MTDDLILDAGRCALIVQDLQNDVITAGGAYADTGSPAHASEQNVVANVVDLAAACRSKGIPVLHVWFIVEPGAPGLKVNAPLFEGVKAGSTVRGTWGAAPVAGLEPQDGDLIVEKMRMSAWEVRASRPCLRASAVTRSSSPVPGRTCPSSTRPAPGPTRATSWSCPRTGARR